VIILAGLFFISLLALLLFTRFATKTKTITKDIHAQPGVIENVSIPSYNKIAVAIDLSSNDAKLIAHAIGQAKNNASFVLIHVVESVSATIYGKKAMTLKQEKIKRNWMIMFRN
jgi:manganese transport protein